jgi:hypothetical protein
MLRKTRDLKGARLGARDGEIGHLKDFYFDDDRWTIRYLLADTGNWLPSTKVLISPLTVKSIHFAAHKVIEVDLDKDQIKHSPTMDAHKPVSEQIHVQYGTQLLWPDYWVGPLVWEPASVRRGVSPPPVLAESDSHHAEQTTNNEDSHLQSAEAVTGYAIQALDRHFGHIEQFILDDETWSIRYLVADLRNWLPGKRVLLAPQWISSVNWLESRVYIDFDRATIQRSPAYDPALPISREYESRLFDHYNGKPYWNRGSEITFAI